MKMEFALIIILIFVGWLAFVLSGDLAAGVAIGLAVAFLVFAFSSIVRSEKLAKRLEKAEKELKEIKELLKNKE